MRAEAIACRNVYYSVNAAHISNGQPSTLTSQFMRPVVFGLAGKQCCCPADKQVNQFLCWLGTRAADGQTDMRDAVSRAVAYTRRSSYRTVKCCS